MIYSILANKASVSLSAKVSTILLSLPSLSTTFTVATLLESIIIPRDTEVIIAGKLSMLCSNRLSLLVTSATHSELLTLAPLGKVRLVSNVEGEMNPTSATADI